MRKQWPDIITTTNMYHLGFDYLRKLHRFLDSIVAVLVLFVIVVFANLNHLPNDLEEFLALRLTVLNMLKVGVLVWLWPKIFSYFGLYEYRSVRKWQEEIISLLKACTVGSLIVLMFPLINGSENFGLEQVAYFWFTAFVLTATLRLFLRCLIGRDVLYAREAHKILIVGSGQKAMDLYRELFEISPAGYDLVGFVDSNLPAGTTEFVRQNLIGSLSELEEILVGQVVDEVLIALPIKSQYEQIEATIQTCGKVGVEAKFIFDKFSSTYSSPRFERGQTPMLTMKLVADDYRRLIKRTIDVTAALCGLIIVSPLLLTIAIAIRLTSKGPIVFSQDRFGQNKRRFKMYKFRTMVTNAEQLQTKLEEQNEASGPIFKIKNDPRITPLGHFLRKTSLDELPQLFNILRGEMSLVGPRPLPLRDVSNFEAPAQMRRFCVPPGLTCLWQISGRSTLGGEDLVTLDLEYIDKWSLSLDLQILARTVPVVLKGSGAS